MSEIERKIAVNTQEKFEFYVISLVFTLLAVSIQTAEFNFSKVSDSFELAGWAALLISGIFGLWRVEYLPDQRLKLDQKSDLQAEIYEYKKLQMEGKSSVFVLDTHSDQNIDDRIVNLQQGVDALSSILTKLEKTNMLKYSIHRVSFLIGVVCIVIARAYDPAKNIMAGC